MHVSERKLPPLKDPETGVVTIFPKTGSRRPSSARRTTPPIAKSAGTMSPADEARSRSLKSVESGLRPLSPSPTGTAPPPPVAPSISENEKARKAAETPDPALSSFFPKLVVPIDSKTDEVVQDAYQFDSLRDIKPGYGTGVQLAAIGPEDSWLTIEPQTTFFKAVYKSHTNFAVTTEEQFFQSGFKFGFTNTLVLPLAGEALTDAWLEIELPAISATGTWVEDVGFAMIKEWRLIIGETLVQYVPRDWSRYCSLARVDSEKNAGLLSMIGSGPLDVSVSHTLYIPLPFFFCSAGSSPGGLRTVLPIGALSNASSKTGGVRVEAVAEDLSNLVNLTTSPSSSLPTSISNATVLLDYALMDTMERAAFLAFGHRILYRSIVKSEEPAYDSLSDGTASTRASTTVGLDGVNRNVANLVILATDENEASKKTLFKYRSINSIDLFLNGQQKRFATRPGDYFALVVPYDRIGGVPEPGSNVYTYSFVAPGTCQTDNGGHVDLSAFSRPILRASGVGGDSSSPAVIRVLSECYNFLTVRDGFAKTDRV